MSDALPDPLLPPDIDLRSMPYTPIFRARLFGSAFHARVSDAAWRAGVTLWLKSWDQVPAGTLPGDEVDLCRLAELGHDVRSWRKIRAEAMWGWIKCSDGRFYHPVVAEGVNAAWQSKEARRDRTEKARQARLSQRTPRSVAASNGTEHNVTESPYTPRGAGQSQSRKRGSTFGLKPVATLVHDPAAQWRNRLTAFAKTGAWPPMFGPPPGAPGCDVPADLVRDILGVASAAAPDEVHDGAPDTAARRGATA
jgi:hypothetical protein